jgi:hypothetical protein
VKGEVGMESEAKAADVKTRMEAVSLMLNFCSIMSVDPKGEKRKKKKYLLTGAGGSMSHSVAFRSRRRLGGHTSSNTCYRLNRHSLDD